MILIPFINDGDITLYAGDCIEVMRQIPADSIDAIITDPPYGLEFMGKGWDAFAPIDFESFSKSWAREAFRVLKPGAHLLAFGGTRTYHRLAAGIEDAGFEIRDCLAWLYGSGFPKSLDVSKAIDKAAGEERTDRITEAPGLNRVFSPSVTVTNKGTPVTAAAAWDGWGTALKPAFEPVVLARKPLTGTVAQNVLQHGTGALNIGATRIGTDERIAAYTSLAPTHGNKLGAPGTAEARRGTQGYPKTYVGRWPANVALDNTAAAILNEQSGERAAGAHTPKQGLGSATVYGDATRSGVNQDRTQLDSGGASRFFYTAKASRTDRNTSGANNTHPTVKPTDLMRWLIRLVTPPDGIILDPFGGSGTTGVAARAENVRCILIEREDEYLNIIRQRLAQLSLFSVPDEDAA